MEPVRKITPGAVGTENYNAYHMALREFNLTTEQIKEEQRKIKEDNSQLANNLFKNIHFILETHAIINSAIIKKMTTRYAASIVSLALWFFLSFLFLRLRGPFHFVSPEGPLGRRKEKGKSEAVKWISEAGREGKERKRSVAEPWSSPSRNASDNKDKYK